MKKTTTLTVALTLVFVIAAVFLLVFSFRSLKTSDVSYAQVENPNEEIEEKTKEEIQEESFANGRIKKYRVLQVLEVEGNTYYQYTSEIKPDPEYIKAKEAAEIANEAFMQTYPDKYWEGEFVLMLYPTRDVGYFAEDDTKDMVPYVWIALMPLNEHDNSEYAVQMGEASIIPMTMINPLTGEIVAMSCPNQDWLHNYGYNTPWISLHDFINFTNEQTWIRIGSKYIREKGLNGNEIVVRADESTDITFGLNGTVSVTFLLGNGTNASKILLTIDLYTKECVGYIIYENMKIS